MNVRAIAATAALAAAAVALSACSPTDTTAGSPVGPDRVITLSPEPTASPAHLSAPPSWIDVTARGITTQTDTLPPTQYGGVPAPGITMLSDPHGDSWDMCTLGPAIQKVDGSGEGFATAGHCGEDDPSQRLQLGPDDISDVRAYAALSDIMNGIDPDSGLLSDSAAAWGGGISEAAVRIAGTWPVAGVLTPDAARNLPPGVSVCFDGAVSRVVCGPLISDEEDPPRLGDAEDPLLKFAAISVRGDSGAPVFLVDGTTGASAFASSTMGNDDTPRGIRGACRVTPGGSEAASNTASADRFSRVTFTTAA